MVSLPWNLLSLLIQEISPTAAILKAFLSDCAETSGVLMTPIIDIKMSTTSNKIIPLFSFGVVLVTTSPSYKIFITGIEKLNFFRIISCSRKSLLVYRMPI
jgi:hypothetical protein